MVNIKQAKKEIEKQIKDFESAVYQFETVVYPRFETDKNILTKLKEDWLKSDAIERRLDEGEEVSQEEIYDAIPEAFR